MAPIRRQRKSSDTKQRSFHLTDDVYAIVEREASAQGISNSTYAFADTGLSVPLAWTVATLLAACLVLWRRPVP